MSAAARFRYLPLFICAAILGLVLHFFARADGISNPGFALFSGVNPITGGADKQVCFNDGGKLSCGDAGFTYNKSSHRIINTGGLQIAANSWFFTDVGGAFTGWSGATIGFSAGNDPTAGSDTILTRKGAANFQFGAVDANPPVAQTTGVQSVPAGNSNVAGANWTRKASASTGSASGGAHVWQVSPAGVSSTSVNTYVDGLRLDANAHLLIGSTTAPALTSCGGGSPTITGTDQAGVVTMGTTATGCIITFNKPYANTPICVVSWIANPLASQSYVTSTANISTTQTSTSGNKLQYVCYGQNAG
jgi:hypothetical protein